MSLGLYLRQKSNPFQIALKRLKIQFQKPISPPDSKFIGESKGSTSHSDNN